MMIKPLTSLRFIFALMVFASHLDYIRSDDAWFQKVNKLVFAEGYVGVSFFFMLSGFVLSLTYRERIIQGSVSIKEFWVARAARIYPLHFVMLLVAIPLTVPEISTAPPSWLLKFFSNLFLVQSFIPVSDYFFSFNAPSWSISCELFFYLMFPWIILALYRKKINFAVCILFILLIPLGTYVFPPALEHRFFYINPLFRLADFLIGILIFELYDKGIFDKFFKSKRTATLLETLAVTLFLLFFAFHSFIPQGYRYASYYWLPITLLLMAFAYQKGYLSQLLSVKLLYVLGERSYGFYLLHILVMRYMLFINRKLQLIANDYLLTCCIFTVVLMASFFSYKIIEVPANRYIRKKYQDYLSDMKTARITN
ncbi:acyltransferase family protein [Botryobacter ruber]|uniref:acyltransferase family protein n=1 Tax=Botryobacter ruber TaxID=2171629 RepID=UPI000E0A4664|nr:acyltransferase [Botryobacter ruber]